MKDYLPGLLTGVLAVAVMAVPGGCAGQGQGQVSGALFLRGCPDQGSNDATGMPSVPPFALDPTYFAAESIHTLAIFGMDPADPRDVEVQDIRLQRGPELPEYTDVLRFVLTDVAALQRQAGQPVPITVPALDQPSQPLPINDGPRIQAALTMLATCPFPRVEPALHGSITFHTLGFELGEWLDASFSLTVEDPRGVRSGKAPQDMDAAGQLSGYFRFQIQMGPGMRVP